MIRPLDSAAEHLSQGALQLAALDVEARRGLLSGWVDQPDPEQLGALIAASADADRTVRLLALQVLEELSEPSALPCVLRALSDPAPEVREAAAAALAAYRGSELAGPLWQALEAAPSPARRALLVALRERPLPSRLEPLLGCLRDGDRDVRHEAVVTIGHLRATGARAALRERLDDADAAVQRAALSVLAQLDLIASAADLIAALAADDWRVRAEAARQLGRLRPTDAAHGAAVAALSRGLEDASWQVRKEAILALGAMAASEACAALTRELSSPLADLRRAAASALGVLGARTARPALEELARDADAEVRKAATHALSALRD